MTLDDFAVWAYEEFKLNRVLNRSSISRILNTSHIINLNQKDRTNARACKLPDLENKLAAWVLKMEGLSVSVTGDAIVEKARRLAESMELMDQPKFSIGWLIRFQKRHGLKSRKKYREEGSVDPDDVIRGRRNTLAETLMYDACDVYNMDECGVFYRMQPDRSIGSKKTKGVKKEKSRITVALAVNADGSHKLPLFFYWKRNAPPLFWKKECGTIKFIL